MREYKKGEMSIDDFSKDELKAIIGNHERLNSLYFYVSETIISKSKGNITAESGMLSIQKYLQNNF